MGKIRLTGATSGYTEIQAASAAGNNTIILPTTNGGQVIVSDSSGNVNIDSGTLYVDATNNRVGIGTTAPESLVHINGDATALRITRGSSIGFLYSEGTSTTSTFRVQANGGPLDLYSGSSQPITFSAATSEKARLDSSGRLLVGTPTARTNFAGNETAIQVEATNPFLSGISVVTNRSSSDANWPSFIRLGRSGATSLGSNTIVANNNRLGSINFCGTDGTSFLDAALVYAEVDGTPGSNDMPGRLCFATTTDGQGAPTERMRIANDGLHSSYSNAVVTVWSSNYSASASNTIFFGRYGATAVNGGIDCIYIRSNGNIQNTNNSYGAISDIKLKENIVDASSQWDDLKALQVRNYNFKEGQTHTQIGLVAQEVELVSPGLVTESPDRDAEGNDLGTVTKSVNYSVLYMKAVKALQEAMERIEQLETEMAEVKAQLQAS